MQKKTTVFILTLFLFCGFIAEAHEEKNGIISLYNQFNCENISQNDIEEWLDQFDVNDQEAAILLLKQIEYFSYKRLMSDLKLLHKRLLAKLQNDGFIDNSEKELSFDAVDFSKTYSAKSDDLISYFYRSANLIRAVCFKNLSDLSLVEDHSNKALVILEDYVGTGTQFLFEQYSKRHHQLFNSYKKVYFVVLVAAKNAITRFEKIANGEHEALVQEFIEILNIQDNDAKENAKINIKKIPKDKLEIIYLHKEIPLNDSSRNCQTTKTLLTLLQKYNIKRYFEGSFSSFGHTVFFYNCPNNLPEILWNSQSIQRDGTPWLPLFKRVEDLSVYEMSKKLPLEEQIW